MLWMMLIWMHYSKELGDFNGKNDVRCNIFILEIMYMLDDFDVRYFLIWKVYFDEIYVF